jgi:hypothetical protein
MDLSLVLSLGYLISLKFVSYCWTFKIASFSQHLEEAIEVTDYRQSISLHLGLLLTKFCSGTALQRRISPPILK